MAYQVPMIELAVDVAVEGADPQQHFIYLAPFSEHRAGPETLEDYLNGRRRFFPMIVRGLPKMINRDRIRWVRYEKLSSPIDLEVTIVARITILELADGSRLEGTVPIDRPRDQSRISDALNDDRQFFLRVDDEEDTYYVNKDYIRCVIPR